MIANSSMITLGVFAHLSSIATVPSYGRASFGSGQYEVVIYGMLSRMLSGVINYLTQLCFLSDTRFSTFRTLTN